MFTTLRSTAATRTTANNVAAKRFYRNSNALRKDDNRPDCYSDRATRRVTCQGVSASPIAKFWDEVADEKAVADAPKYKNNIENYIGTVKVPVGLVGPLLLEMEVPTSAKTKKEYLVPMATHEGALVASYNRGIKAITRSGGAYATVLSREMIRAPVVQFDNVQAASKFFRWINTPKITKEIEAVIAKEPHCRLTNFFPIQTDFAVHLHIGIDSEDAAGQNMVTYCGRAVMEYVKANYNEKGKDAFNGVFIEGGFNSGKRGSNIHLRPGKGIYTVVDAELPDEVVRNTLKTTPDELATFHRLHQRAGFFLGSMSHTAHVANGLCAFYIANGQDPACTAESQGAVTHFESCPDPKNPGKKVLKASMTLPSLITSTIGGGTGLPSQSALLKIIDVSHPDQLACVLAATCLGGELSFYAAMASDQFDAAHWNATHKVQ
eukprot:TRINITY_DN469_c0_g1_i1.p1 TRINITY_DN469_c0_g1~~TRINITY_DN469_c0_g1_i1.p1  ORF type:complete len:435 (-),score=21.12 TRINITY_DN469_c0_g1_i1:56-1360(-)